MRHFYMNKKYMGLLFLFLFIFFMQPVSAQVKSEDELFTALDTNKVILSQEQQSRLQNVKKRKTSADVYIVRVKELDVLLHNESLCINIFSEYSFNLKRDKIKQYADDNFDMCSLDYDSYQNMLDRTIYVL